MDAEILEAVAAQEPAMVDLLVELVEAPTVLGEEASGQAIMRRAFTELGLEPVDVVLDAARLEAHPAAAPFSWELDGKANVVATWAPDGPEQGRSLILNGHIDIVSAEPAALWTRPPSAAGPPPLGTRPPFAAQGQGDWLYGRGAGDMKSGLVAMVGAVRGLQGLGLTPRAPVELQSVVEEECTGNGTLACVLAGHTADAAILPEPTPRAR